MNKKKSYVAPAMKKYGSMKSLTLGLSGSNTDGFGGNIQATTPPIFTTFIPFTQ